MIEDDASDFYDFSGEYTSNLDKDDGGNYWWLSEDKEYCIWLTDSLWRVGLCKNIGTNEADIASTESSDCPHNLVTSTGEQVAKVKWQYKVGEEDWEEAKSHGIFTITGKVFLYGAAFIGAIQFHPFSLSIFQRAVIHHVKLLRKQPHRLLTELLANTIV